MPHPFVIFIAAASTTVLAAALRDGNSLFFFLGFSVFCFVLAAMVRCEAVPDTSRPLFWIVPGAILLTASANLASGALALLTLGALYFTLGMIFWLRARYS